ncbi:MAG: single-stranded DNA-binding protein, partial [Bacteroidota bacterium]|nr:single-stranded DNA-binding protein [Bacteroidota bacterium]
MLQATLIGNLGANCQKKEQDGHKFTTFRVANNDSWTDDNGETHNETDWVDCIMNDHPKVADYLLAGTSVFVQGTIKKRVYSSKKDRCMKAGLTIRVSRIELLGGKRDEVP